MLQGKRYEWTKNFTNGDSYSGEAILDNVKDGEGTYYWAASGSTYKGTWNKDQPHGQGTMTVPGAEGYTYFGSFVCGKRCGHGECRFSNGRVYIGEWLDDQMHGQGTLRGGTEDSFKEYKGPFSKGVRSGERGQCIYTNGDRYVGEWFDDKRHGMGDLTLAPEARGKSLMNKLISSQSSSIFQCSNAGFSGYLRPAISSTTVASVAHYKGPFKYDMPACVTGGELTYDDGSTYVGTVDSHLRRSGEGQHQMVNGDVYTGHFCEDERDGRGVLHCAADEVTYDGIWRHGELDGFVTYHRSSPALQPDCFSTSNGGNTRPQSSLKPLIIVDYKGPCVRGEFSGSAATITFSDRSTYHGDVHDGQPSGCGLLENRIVRGCFPQAAFGLEVVFLRYEGSFSKGEPNGDGIATLRIASRDALSGSRGDSDTSSLQHEGAALVHPSAGGLQLRFDRSGTFRGQWSRGIPEGSGEWHWKSGSEVYQGDVHLGLPSGQGFYKSASEQYEGHFEEGLPCGYGTYRNVLTHVTFRGNWLAGSYHGLGDWSLNPSDAEGSTSSVVAEASYKGSWQKGKKHGRGLERNAEEIYEGDFVDGMRHGYGVLRHHPDDGYCYEGSFSQGKLSGPSGKLTLPNGTMVTGSFEDGAPHGDNICAVFPQGLTFKGRYDHGCPIGVGSITYANGDHYSGEVELVTPVTGFQDWTPQRHGKGTYTFAEGNRLECTWRHNILNGHGKHITPNGEISERHYTDGIILSKVTSGVNMFTPENEFPNTQSERVLKAKLESINQPHKFIRRGEARQAVKSAVPSVATNGSIEVKGCTAADIIPQNSPTAGSTKQEAPSTTPPKGPRRPRHNVEAPVSNRQSSSRNHNPTSPFNGITDKRVTSMEDPPPPCSQPGKTTPASVPSSGKGNEKASITGAMNDPARLPKRSTNRVTGSKTGKDACRPPVNDRKTTSQEYSALSSVPQRLSSNTSANYTSKRASSLCLFQNHIKRLNANNEDLSAEEDVSAIGKEAYAIGLTSAVRSGCNSSSDVAANGIADVTLRPHASVPSSIPLEGSLAKLMQEACEIRSITEDEVYALTEKLRSLNEKIWQLRFLLSSKPETVTLTCNRTEKHRAEEDMDISKWESLEAMQRERRDIVEALRCKLEVESRNDS